MLEFSSSDLWLAKFKTKEVLKLPTDLDDENETHEVTSLIWAIFVLLSSSESNCLG
jgi:hypothetical protein